AVVSQTGTQEFPSIASDGANGAIIAWDDTRNGPASDVYAQHVGASGNPQWSLGGVAISTATLYQTNPFVTTDSNGGAVILWRDNRGFSSIDIYAQRVNALGVTQWTPDGVQLTTAPANASTTPLVWDGNAVITAFTDFRNGPGDIYAQRVEGHYGYWGHPEPVVTSVADVPKDQGGHVAVNWTASQRDVTNPHTVDSYTIWRAVNTVPFGVDASQVLQDIKDARGKQGHIYLSAGPATDYYWELVGTQAAHGWAGYSFSAETRADSVAGNSANERFMVAAQTNADNFVAFQSNAVQGHSVDNLAPATPLLLTISQAGANAVLNWKPVPDADLAHYTLYRKTGSGVTPVIGNFLTQESLTNHIDAGAAAGGYYYIVVAVDAHGNMSAPSNEVSLNGSTGVDGATPLAHLVVDANAPNPFASQSEFRVGLPRAANIDVSLYDVGGRLVGVRHVAGVKGWQKVAIDGRDTSGRALASGVYFYRVSAAGETITRKMVIAR
ncbi:MAG TPA: T9SS type A sorting domain-containing protein, partial [Candidatus Krumholzibacteria bacterium]|nr:T9SS type A sorting domain-containing protein [Candidatus Krumholzibacteria bacterium]